VTEILDQDIIEVADEIVLEFGQVLEKIRGKVPAISVCLALLFLTKKIVEAHRNQLKPEEKEFLITVLLNFLNQTLPFLESQDSQGQGEESGSA
jgi:hypothetical protein